MIVFGIIFIAYAPVILVLNVLLVVSLKATKQSLKNTSNLLITCLSVSDALSGIILLPLLGIEHIWYADLGHSSLNPIRQVLQIFFGTNSIGMTMLLAIDRYLHMNPDFQRSPSRFAKLFERPRVFMTIIATYSFFAVVSVAYYFQMGSKRSLFFSLAFTVFNMAVIASFIVVYTRGYFRIRRHVAENPIHANRAERNSTDGRPVYLNELFKTVLLLLILMLITWTPLLLLNLLTTIDVVGSYQFYSSGPFNIFIRVSFLCFYSNAAISTLIIFYRNKKSKEWLTERFRCCFHWRHARGAQNNSAVIANIGVAEPSIELRSPAVE